jgi:DNA-directed RNA polymerase specialized sigma24 family protein
MSASFGGNPTWWDREFDYTGRPIRTDVRAAAHEVWDQACRRVQAVLGDISDAASIMERTVFQVSRYLDRIGSAPFSGNTHGLLITAFCRALQRYRTKLRRTELVADMHQLSERVPTASHPSKEDCRLDAEKAARLLSRRGRTMLQLRSVGLNWKEIGAIFKMTDCAARAEFSREVKRAKAKAGKKTPRSNNS